MNAAEACSKLTLPFTLAAVLCAAPSARASEGDSAGAEALFREGKRLLDAGDYATACPKLAASYRLDPATGALLATALCYERAGKLASAWAAYMEVAARSNDEGRSDREESALARAEALEPKLPRLVVTAGASARVPDLVVLRDGVAVGTAILDTPLPVDPGEHRIEARASGKRPFEMSVTLEPGQTARVEIVFDDREATAVVAAPARAPSSGEAPRSSASFWTPLRATGLAVGVVGLGGLVAGGVFGAKALSLKAESDAQCSGDDCAGDGYDDRMDARSAGNLSTLCFVAGGVLAAGGITLFVLGAPDDGRLETAVSASPSGAFVSVRHAF